MCSNLLLPASLRNHRLFLIPQFELWNLSLTVEGYGKFRTVYSVGKIFA